MLCTDMTTPDLNLLATLDVLLAEGSVARAARRLRLSPSAMSRTLSRLRAATGDPLLVRAGRGLVPTPRALELREPVARLVQEAAAVLRPQAMLDLERLTRAFTLRTSDGFVETFAANLIALVARQAPGVRLRFVQKPEQDRTSLRNDGIDLETGVVDETSGPEVRAVALFHDRFIGVIRNGHPLAEVPITPQSYAASRHVHVSRRGLDRGLVDEVLATLGLQREIAVTVTGFAAALALARTSDLVATLPERHTAGLRTGMQSFALPVSLPEITVSLQWHPRFDADPAHRWLRDCVRSVCAERVAL